MSEIQDQGALPPVTDPAQGATTPVTAPAPAQPETTPLQPTIPQSDWQRVQEQIREQNRIIADVKRQQFEKENPIVLNDKYKEKWKQMMELKNTPNHRYSQLEHEELLRIMRDPVELEARPIPQPMTVPSFNPSVSPDLPTGSIHPEAKQWLSMMYSEDEIKASERSAS